MFLYASTLRCEKVYSFWVHGTSWDLSRVGGYMTIKADGQNHTLKRVTLTFHKLSQSLM